MYQVKEDGMGLYVVHTVSGECMRYSSNATDTKNIYEAANINGYYDMFWPWVYEYSPKDRKKVLYQMNKTNDCPGISYPTLAHGVINTPYHNVNLYESFVASATCPPSMGSLKTAICGPVSKMKKKEEDMTTCTKSDAMIQRDYLISELRSVSMTKRSEAEKTFGLRDDDRPNTFNQLLARITSGKYTIDDKYKDRNTYGCPMEFIHWRDPAVKEDQEGYDAFVKAVQVAATATERTIKIAEPAAGLDALIAFEAMTFSPTVH